ncbi:MAG: hypothetical protein QG646_1358 [Euryarchaeota archaeon]|nr:hypothetical protein [Euryarchaeota archaeon]
MKNKIILPLFFFLLMMIAFQFFPNSHASDRTMNLFGNKTVKSMENDENKVSEGFGFGVYHNQVPLVGMNITQHLKVNENFEGYLNIANEIKKGNQYLLFALLDYKQIPFYINGSKNETHLVSLGPMEGHFYPFKIDGLSPGSHDLLIGVFLNPYNHSLNSRYRYDTDFSMMGSKRLNVIVGNGSTSMPEFKKPKTFYQSSNFLEGLLVNKEPFSAKSWLVEDVKKNETLEYYINIGNSSRKNQRTFAIVQFLDYKQIPIMQNTSDYVYFGRINKSEEGAIPASLIVPDKNGVHELIVVWVSDPYENLEISPGKLNTNLEGRVEPSIRIGLNVS